MKIETQAISLTAPTSSAKPSVQHVPKVQEEPKFEAKSSEVEKNPSEVVKAKKLGIEDKAKVEALADRLINDNKALVIEKNPEGSGFIYKSIDRNTGEVVRVWPREVVATALQSLQDVDARGLMLDESA